MIDFFKKMYDLGYFDPDSEKYFWVDQMEWLSEKDRGEYADDTGENILPIAQNSGGDIWGIDLTDGHVVLCCHDEEKPICYADNLKNAIFKAIVGYLSDNSFETENPDDNDENTEAFARRYIDECIELFKGNFSEEQIADLKSIGKNEITEFSNSRYSYKSFISVEDADKIIKKYIPTFEPENSGRYILDEALPIRERVPFSEEDYISLSDHCLERVRKFFYKHNELLDIVKGISDLRMECYKGAADDKYIARISAALESGIKLGKAVEESALRDGRKYFINESGEPVYSEKFVGGKLCQRTFYFADDNETYAVNYSVLLTNGKIKFGNILEAGYDRDNKTDHVIFYDESNINWYDKYYYKDGKIDRCEEFDSFLYDRPVSYITDKVTPDGIFYGDKNPMLVYVHNYIYEKDIVSEIESISCNLEQISVTREKARSVEYKKLMKDNII